MVFLERIIKNQYAVKDIRRAKYGNPPVDYVRRRKGIYSSPDDFTNGINGVPLSKHGRRILRIERETMEREIERQNREKALQRIHFAPDIDESAPESSKQQQRKALLSP